jgi:hypothetical protein
MSNISPSKPSFLLTYYNPFDKNAPGLVDSYLDYAKDVNLAKYGASIVSAAIEKASKMQSIQLQNGFKMIDQRLSSIVYEQVTTNLLLNDIKDLLKLPDSEKEKLFHINSGLKYLSKVNYNDIIIKDAINEFEKAYKIAPNDWFVNYYLGICYLHYPNVLNLEKAERYFTTTIKYASIEDNYSIQSSYKSFFYAIENEKNIFPYSWPKTSDKSPCPNNWFLANIKDEYYDCLARPYFHLADSKLNMAHIKYIKGDFAMAYAICPRGLETYVYLFTDLKFKEKIYFYRTKYLARCLHNKLETIGDSESIKEIKEIKSIIFLEAALNDKDINQIPEYVEILQSNYKSALNKLNKGTAVKKTTLNTVARPMKVTDANSNISVLDKVKKSSYLWQIVFISIGLYFFSQGDRKWGFIGVCVGIGYGYNQWLGNRKNK